MSSKAEAVANTGSGPVDILKWIVGIAVVVAGVGAFYWFEQQWPTYSRILAVVGGLGVGAAVLLSTAMGKRFLNFAREAQFEMRKVVWPTRQETVQTTLVIMVVVVIVGIILWVIDYLLAWAVRLLIG